MDATIGVVFNVDGFNIADIGGADEDGGILGKGMEDLFGSLWKIMQNMLKF